jgi:hypothetical protein
MKSGLQLVKKPASWTGDSCAGSPIIAVAVPPGFPAEYALADLVGEPRPLMVSKDSRVIRYILVRENDPGPYIARERDLLPSGKPSIEIGSIRREGAP